MKQYQIIVNIYFIIWDTRNPRDLYKLKSYENHALILLNPKVGKGINTLQLIKIY